MRSKGRATTGDDTKTAAAILYGAEHLDTPPAKVLADFRTLRPDITERTATVHLGFGRQVYHVLRAAGWKVEPPVSNNIPLTALPRRRLGDRTDAAILYGAEHLGQPWSQLFGDFLSRRPDVKESTATTFLNAGRKTVHVLRVAGWTVEPPPATLIPEEIPNTTVALLTEGAMERIAVNRYERNPEARRQCINHYGATCAGCDINLESVYGEELKGYIHVHHKISLETISRDYNVDPIRDLVPLCPNCHAVIHWFEPPLTVEKLRQRIEENRQGRSASA